MKNAKKLLSLLCAVTIVFTCFAGITSVRSLADSDTDKIIAAAADYVKKAQNTVTKEELLSAVQKIDGSITLKNEDFYIKHSVDGCYDDDTISGYPLKIEGSDGAVAAIFYKGDTPITFSHAFSHYEQLIHIEKVAVAGQSEGFEYNRRGGSIIGYTGDADKIVIPKGYKGTLSKISDDKFPNRDNVKVIMIKNSDTTYNLTADSLNGFAGNAEDPDPESWKFRSLIALDIFGGENFGWSDKKNIFANKDTAAYLPNLKYLYLPESLDNGDNISNWCFSYLPSLVNVNVPYCSGTIMWGAFRNTGAREFTYSIREVDFESKEKYGLSNGTVNEIDCNKEATFIEGLAYVSASINEQLTNGKTEEEVLNNPAQLAKGWKNMSAGWPNLVSPSTDYFKTFTAKLASDWKPCGSSYLKSYSLSDGKSSADMYFIKKDPKIEEEENLIIDAACDYVDNNKNICTYEGLLDAVSAVSANVKLSVDDFYIKHAVDGCTDTDTKSGYRLDIPGSDGSVSAIFSIFDEEYAFVRAFSRQDELIEITKVAVVGEDPEFKYDDEKNVIGYSGDADKIVFPAGYVGTLAAITDAGLFPNRDNIKVIVFANGDKAVPLKAGALNGYTENSNESYQSWAWQSLRAVEIYKDKAYFYSTNDGRTNIFAQQGIIRNLPNLKYLALPKILDNLDTIAQYNIYCMPALENVNVPAKAYIQENVFYNTALREIQFGLPGYMNDVEKWGNAAHNDDGYGFSQGTRNVILDSAISDTIKDITFVQATAYAAAALNKLITSGYDLNAVPSATLTDVNSWSRSSESYFNAMDVKYNTSWQEGDIVDTAIIDISHGSDIAKMAAFKVNTLLNLSAGVELKPSFNPQILEYSVKVPYDTTSLDLKYTLAEDAACEIINNLDFEVGVEKQVKINVTTAAGKQVTYIISVTRDKEYSLDEAFAIVAESAEKFKADNLTSQSEYEAALKDSIATTGCSLVLDDFYLYKSLAGAKDNYGIITPGYNGYIISNITVKNTKESKSKIIKSVVLPDLNEYTFAKNEVSTAKDFMLSSDGKSLEYYTGEARKIVIPEGIENIEMGWFDGNVANAQVIVFPSSVKEFDGSGFCSKLRHLEVCVLGDDVISLPQSFFENCYMLKTVHLPEALESIGASAFAYTCMLEELYIPSNVKSIASKAFWQAGIRNAILPYAVEELSNDTFAYPCNGASDCSYLCNEVKDENDIKLVDDFYHSKIIDNLRIRVLSPNVTYDRAFSSNDTGRLGHVVTVYAPAEYQGAYDPTGQNSSFNFDMDMSFLEACAYAQVYMDNVCLSDKSTADDVLEMAKNSFYSLSDYKTVWAKPFVRAGSKASGTVKLINGNDEFEISFDRPVYKEAETEFFTFKYSSNDTYTHDYTTEFKTKTIYNKRIIEEEEENISTQTESEDTTQKSDTASSKRRLVRKRIIYPFYMQTWFIVTVSIAGILIVSAVVVLIVLNAKKRRKNKVIQTR